MTSNQPPELPAQLAQHKRISELEKENEKLKQELSQARAARDTSGHRYAELEREVSTLLPPSDAPLQHRILLLGKERTDALEEAARLTNVRQSHEQRRARWRELLEQALGTLSYAASDASDAQSMMALAAKCADCLVREEESRFGELEADVR